MFPDALRLAAAVTKLGGNADVVVIPGVGKSLVLDVAIPEDAPEALREGLARRAIVNRGGTCPCGARMVLPNRAQRRAGATTLNVDVHHEDDCPAVTANVARLLQEWRARR